MTREEMNKDIQDEIEIETKKIGRKKIIKRIIKALIIISTILIIFFLYNKYITTNIIKVNEQRITSSKLPDSFIGNKIIHFSDLQYGSNIFNDKVNELVEIINLRNPDIILFTGDLIDKDYNIKSKEKEELIKILSKIKGNIGKYAVKGDEDKEDFTTILTQSGFTVLDNNYDLVYNKENNPILITGLSKKTDIDKTFEYFKQEQANKNIFTILLLHEPDNIDNVIDKYNVDLAFAGGNLNGLINIPKLNGLFTRKNSKKYTNPFYQLNNTKLYVSSGIGTDGIGIRLFTRPSINFIRLASTK